LARRKKKKNTTRATKKEKQQQTKRFKTKTETSQPQEVKKQKKCATRQVKGKEGGNMKIKSVGVSTHLSKKQIILGKKIIRGFPQKEKIFERRIGREGKRKEGQNDKGPSEKIQNDTIA